MTTRLSSAILSNLCAAESFDFLDFLGLDFEAASSLTLGVRSPSVCGCLENHFKHMSTMTCRASSDTQQTSSKAAHAVVHTGTHDTCCRPIQYAVKALIMNTGSGLVAIRRLSSWTLMRTFRSSPKLPAASSISRARLIAAKAWPSPSHAFFISFSVCDLKEESFPDKLSEKYSKSSDMFSCDQPRPRPVPAIAVERAWRYPADEAYSFPCCEMSSISLLRSSSDPCFAMKRVSNTCPSSWSSERDDSGLLRSPARRCDSRNSIMRTISSSVATSSSLEAKMSSISLKNSSSRPDSPLR